MGATTYLGTDSQIEVALSDELSLIARMQNGIATSEQFGQGQSVFVQIADGAAQFLVE